jgi:hypothetical protein
MLDGQAKSAIGAGSVLFVFILIHFYRLFNTPPQLPNASNHADIFYVNYDPLLAWTRTCIYFLYAVLLCIPTGLLEVLLFSQVASEAQVSNVLWIFSTLGTVLIILLLYGYLWPRWTLNYNRLFQWIPCAIFGVLQGTSTGMILCNIWFLFDAVVLADLWVTWVASWCMMILWQYVFGMYYWSIYVLPEQDTHWSLKMKMLVCQVPNITLTLTYLLFWNNAAIFVLLQMMASLGTAFRMRFPSPWIDRKIEGAACKRGIFGLAVAIGAQNEDHSIRDEDEIKEALLV